MKMDDVLRVYGAKNKVADALGLTPTAISLWGDQVPLLRQYQLAALTAGRLTVDTSLRVDVPRRSHKGAKARATSRAGRAELLARRKRAKS